MAINPELDTPLGRQALENKLRPDKLKVSVKAAKIGTAAGAVVAGVVSQVDGVNAGTHYDLATNSISVQGFEQTELGQGGKINKEDALAKFSSVGFGSEGTPEPIQVEIKRQINDLANLVGRSPSVPATLEQLGLMRLTSLDGGVLVVPTRTADQSKPGDFDILLPGNFQLDGSPYNGKGAFKWQVLPNTPDDPYELVKVDKGHAIGQRNLIVEGAEERLETKYYDAKTGTWVEVQMENVDILQARHQAELFLNGTISDPDSGFMCNAGKEKCSLSRFFRSKGFPHKFDAGSAAPNPLLLGAYELNGVGYMVFGGENVSGQRFVWLGSLGEMDASNRLAEIRFRLADTPELRDTTYNSSSHNYNIQNPREVFTYLKTNGYPAQADITMASYSSELYKDKESLGRLNPEELAKVLVLANSKVVEPIFQAYESQNLVTVNAGQMVELSLDMHPKSISAPAAPLFRTLVELTNLGKSAVVAPYISQFMVSSSEK